MHLRSDLLSSSSASYRWVGLCRTTESESNIESMKQITTQWFEKDLVLPSIRESEKFKQAINRGLTLHEMGQEDLAYPLTQILHLETWM